jgi:hypothetical protein
MVPAGELHRQQRRCAQLQLLLLILMLCSLTTQRSVQQGSSKSMHVYVCSSVCLLAA